VEHKLYLVRFIINKTQSVWELNTSKSGINTSEIKAQFKLCKKMLPNFAIICALSGMLNTNTSLPMMIPYAASIKWNQMERLFAHTSIWRADPLSLLWINRRSPLWHPTASEALILKSLTIHKLLPRIWMSVMSLSWFPENNGSNTWSFSGICPHGLLSQQCLQMISSCLSGNQMGMRTLDLSYTWSLHSIAPLSS
jgi:hypothetical protein